MQFLKRILIFALLCHIPYVVEAQYITEYNEKITFDVNIAQLRVNATPNFRYRYDDYLQYAPAVLELGLKVFKYQGRSSWAEIGVSTAFSVAIMAGLTNGMKYSISRLRPDGSKHNSFPSGHAATAFMLATMLHKEYGERSKWFSIGGYWTATIVGYSRILNDKHWMTDVLAGAAIGIGSVHLGYFLNDLIFKKYHSDDRRKSSDAQIFDPEHRYYGIETFVSQRFILCDTSRRTNGDMPYTGGGVGLEARFPIIPQAGIVARTSANSLTYHNLSDTSETGERSSNMYNFLVGGYYSLHFLKICETDFKALAGYAVHAANGLDLTGGIATGVCAGENFRIKIFAEYEAAQLSGSQFLNSICLGLSFATVW